MEKRGGGGGCFRFNAWASPLWTIAQETFPRIGVLRKFSSYEIGPVTFGDLPTYCTSQSHHLLKVVDGWSKILLTFSTQNSIFLLKRMALTGVYAQSEVF
jgi:hypothetical protein